MALGLSVTSALNLTLEGSVGSFSVGAGGGRGCVGSGGGGGCCGT